MTPAPTSLRGARVLVTGAGRRVGRAIALAFAREGASIALHHHESRAGALDTAREVEQLGGSAVVLGADLADRAATRRLVDEAVAALGGLDHLVPSAAGYEAVDIDAITDDHWDRLLELDLTSPFLLAQRSLPALRAAGGSIVFVTCASATVPFRRHLPYVVAKGGLRQLMRTLALELAPRVRVNAVAPGTVLPPPDLDGATIERIRERIPLGRLGEPSDVAEAVVALARAPFVTGQELVVDGGRSVAAVETFG